MKLNLSIYTFIILLRKYIRVAQLSAKQVVARALLMQWSSTGFQAIGNFGSPGICTRPA